MARITYSALVTRINGTIGGTTFQDNKHGFTVKNKANIVKPQSDRQTAQQSRLARASAAWSTTTSANRSAWDACAAAYPQYAKNNPSSQLSGRDLFIKFYCFIWIYDPTTAIGGIPCQYAPNPKISFSSVEVKVNSTDIYICHTNVASPDPNLGHFYLSPVVASTKNFVGSEIRYMLSEEIDVTQCHSATTEYLAKFGQLPSVGDRVFAGIHQMDEGSKRVYTRETFVCDVIAY